MFGFSKSVGWHAWCTADISRFARLLLLVGSVGTEGARSWSPRIEIHDLLVIVASSQLAFPGSSLLTVYPTLLPSQSDQLRTAAFAGTRHVLCRVTIATTD